MSQHYQWWAIDISYWPTRYKYIETWSLHRWTHINLHCQGKSSTNLFTSFIAAVGLFLDRERECSKWIDCFKTIEYVSRCFRDIVCLTCERHSWQSNAFDADVSVGNRCRFAFAIESNDDIEMISSFRRLTCTNWIRRQDDRPWHARYKFEVHSTNAIDKNKCFIVNQWLFRIQTVFLNINEERTDSYRVCFLDNLPLNVQANVHVTLCICTSSYG
jgi:hypothetical protein